MIYDSIEVLCYSLALYGSLKHANDVLFFIKDSELGGSAIISCFRWIVFRWISHYKYLASSWAVYDTTCVISGLVSSFFPMDFTLLHTNEYFI